MRTLWALIWFIVLALGSIGTAAVAKSTVASVPFTFSYDGQTRPTTAYDGPSASDPMTKHQLILLAALLLFCPVAQAQFVVSSSRPEVSNQRTVFPLNLSNGLPQEITSARAVMFILDSKGKVAGQAARWIIGGGTKHPPLSPGATNAFHFVVPTDGKPFATNRLTITQVTLAGGTRANPITDVTIRYERK